MNHADGSLHSHDGTGHESRPGPQEGRLVLFPKPVPYDEAWRLQQQLREERIAENQGDTLLLLEHQPVYTLGRSTKPAHWACGEEALRQTGANFQSVDRGGSITYHGPGQIVGYPILKLSHYCSGPKQYVRNLEEVLIHTLARWGIEGYRVKKAPGVWVRWRDADAKIAAIGVRIDHGVTLHGFALNVDLDLSPFSHIVPCGLTACPITSMAEIRQSPLSIATVTQQVAQEFARTFNVQWLNLPPEITEQGDDHITLAATTLTHS
ncbi:MAG: lipoyl(octanoyl) transferase LipB [Nitrospirota bacterium]|nr:lipoyl(octanoyl) transferase LipB [Nitrospirota bacterium]MDP2383856.1 lipoyl(octanoyl) transferase LipB [Nitrospirota bacterium]MDP3598083.1 lipoyl(octanoyl) transferase LipB [Nitrospirota bacterium]